MREERSRMNIVQHILILGLRVYRCTVGAVQPVLFGPLAGCRFSPSCSAYAMEAIRVHGAMAGIWLGLKRVCRCHPWGECGYDPVPAMKSAARDPKHRVGSINGNRTHCLLPGGVAGEIVSKDFIQRSSARE